MSAVDNFVRFAGDGKKDEALKQLTQLQLQQIEGKLSDADARRVWEAAALLFAREGDVAGFDRCYAQLRPLYFDSTKSGTINDQAQQFVGLQLMRLLADNRTADFHTELELLPQERLSKYVQYPLHLERYLMEGSYHKIRQAVQDAPSQEFTVFVRMMIDNTVRGDIAECIGAAYQHMAPDVLRAKLMMEPAADLTALMAQHGWSQDGNLVRFGKSAGAPASAKAKAAAADDDDTVTNAELIAQTMLYAAELERIV